MWTLVSFLSLSICSCFLFLHRTLKSREQLEDVFADTGSPALSRQSPKYGGDLCVFPSWREWTIASSQTRAAGAAEGLVGIAGARGKPPALRTEISGEKAAVVVRSGWTQGTRRAKVSENTLLVTVVRHPAPVAAVAGETPTPAAGGGTQAGVDWKMKAVVVCLA